MDGCDASVSHMKKYTRAYKPPISTYKLITHIERYLLEASKNGPNLSQTKELQDLFVKAKVSLKVLHGQIDPSYGALAEQLEAVLLFVDQKITGKADKRALVEYQKLLEAVQYLKQGFYPSVVDDNTST